MNLRDFADRVLCVFFPRRCRYCGEVIIPERAVCENCEKNLPRIEKPVCPKCGKSKSDCKCSGRGLYYEHITAPYYYKSAIEKAIGRVKFQHKPFLCRQYARDMAQSVRENFDNPVYDLVCFVPFSKKQKRNRPFNQSELLAENLARELGFQFRDVLVKRYDSSVQHSLGARLRTGNVFGVYDVRDTSQVEGRRILLVDDVKTTGSTLNECAKMLKIHGASCVDCVCFAIGNKKIDTDS